MSTWLRCALICLAPTLSRGRLIQIKDGAELCGAAVERWDRYWAASATSAVVSCVRGDEPRVLALGGYEWFQLEAPEGKFGEAVGLLLTRQRIANPTWAALALAPPGNVACNSTADCADGLDCISAAPHLPVCTPAAVPRPYALCFDGAQSTCSELVASGLSVAAAAAGAVAYYGAVLWRAGPDSTGRAPVPLDGGDQGRVDVASKQHLL